LSTQAQAAADVGTTAGVDARSLSGLYFRQFTD